MNPPADGTPKNLAIQLETPRFWGGFSVFKSWTKKSWGPACPLLGGRWDHPRPDPRKKGRVGASLDLPGRGGERGQGGRSEKERENLTITSIKSFFVEL